MRTVRLEVIAPTLQGLGFCSPCELVLSEAGVGGDPASRGMDEYPQEWQAHFRKLTTWVYEIAERYGEGIVVKVIDPQSPEGLIKSLRHRIRRYPTWIVDGKVCAVGWDRAALEDALQHSWV
jgi:hypothetical protein